MRTLIHHLVRDRALLAPDDPALSYQERTVDYGELWRTTVAIASGFERLGVSADERIAVFAEKRPETVAAIFAASTADAVFVPINPVLRPPQVRHILDDCAVRVLVTTVDRLLALRHEIASSSSLTHIVLIDADNATRPARLGDDGSEHSATRIIVWDELLEHGDEVGDLSTSAAGRIDLDMAAIFYTSGSTGMPKGVVLSHRNLIVGAESVSTYLENRASDVILAALPISFDAGFSQLTTAFAVGAHVVLINYLLPADVVSTCKRYGVTGLTCVPPLWIQLADRAWPPEATGSMRYFANTGGRLPKATLDALRAHFPQAAPYLMYGLTEAFRSTYLDPAQVDQRPSSIGKAIPNAQILVVREDGTPCDPGEEGELVHRGALVAMGYWNDPERTAQRFRPAPGSVSWRQPELAVWSGDTVVTDAEGYLYFVGRSDDMIKTSGYRVSPSEVEEAAYDTGLVRDAVALGVDDPAIGQRVVLVATSPDGEPLDTGRLRAELRQRLALFMVPSTIIEHPDIPRSPNGKFDRTAVKAMIRTES